MDYRTSIICNGCSFMFARDKDKRICRPEQCKEMFVCTALRYQRSLPREGERGAERRNPEVSQLIALMY